MRKFLFEGFKNADFSDELDFDLVGFRSGRAVSPNAEPIAAALPTSAGNAVPAASSASDCVLLNAISTPATQLELDLDVLDSIFSSPSHGKKSYELNHHF